MHKVLLAAALLAASLTTHTAQAQEVRTARVQTSDLDLTKAEGKKTLDRRISRSVNQVCGMPFVSSAKDRLSEMQCRAHARKGASEQRRVAIARAEARGRLLAFATPR